MKTLVSPKGVAKCAWLTEPDYSLDKTGWFSVELFVDHNDASVQHFIDQLNSIRDEHYQKCLAGEIKTSLIKAKLKKLPTHDSVVKVVDRQGKETGQIYFRSMIRALPWKSGESQSSLLTQRPAQYNRSGRRLLPEEEYSLIPDGSIIRLGCSIHPFILPTVAGVRLELLAVQVCKLAGLPRDTPFDFPAD